MYFVMSLILICISSWVSYSYVFRHESHTHMYFVMSLILICIGHESHTHMTTTKKTSWRLCCCDGRHMSMKRKLIHHLPRITHIDTPSHTHHKSSRWIHHTISHTHMTTITKTKSKTQKYRCVMVVISTPSHTHSHVCNMTTSYTNKPRLIPTTTHKCIFVMVVISTPFHTLTPYKHIFIYKCRNFWGLLTKSTYKDSQWIGFILSLFFCVVESKQLELELEPPTHSHAPFHIHHIKSKIFHFTPTHSSRQTYTISHAQSLQIVTNTPSHTHQLMKSSCVRRDDFIHNSCMTDSNNLTPLAPIHARTCTAICSVEGCCSVLQCVAVGYSVHPQQHTCALTAAQA